MRDKSEEEEVDGLPPGDPLPPWAEDEDDEEAYGQPALPPPPPQPPQPPRPPPHHHHHQQQQQQQQHNSVKHVLGSAHLSNIVAGYLWYLGCSLVPANVL